MREDSLDLAALATQGIVDIDTLICHIVDVIVELTNHRFNVNVTKIVASIASIGGGVLTTVGLITLPMTFGASGTLIAAGIGVSATGGAAVLGSDLVELGITKSKFKAIEAKMKDVEEKVGDIQLQYDDHVAKVKEAAKATGQGVSAAAQVGFAAIRIVAEFGDDAAKAAMAKLPLGLGRASAEIGVKVAAVGVALAAVLDIFTIANASIKIHKGNRVECASKLENARDDLEDLKREIQALLATVTVSERVY